MTAAPAPAAAPAPGVVVRIKVDRWIYASKRMPLAEATALANDVKRLLRGFTGLVDLPDFPCESPHLDSLAIWADKVCAVEVRCVNGDGQRVHEAEEAEPCAA
jgi:hypothetical protein